MASFVRKNVLLSLALFVAVAVHATQVLDTWRKIGGGNGRDYASYHYALQVAVDGGNPYHKGQLAEHAQADGTRKYVHPFFYPPPFLLSMAWAAPLDLESGFRAWFWLNGLSYLALALALLWWRPGWPGLAALCLITVSFTPLVNNYTMGQANLQVVALVAWGMALAGRDRKIAGGALVGLACMLKMSPGLLVAWWLVRKDWKPAIAACVTAVLLSVASLPIVGLDEQLHFYQVVLPSLGAGEYNGLTVPIDIFANHSIPNLWFQAMGGWTPGARLGSSLTNLVLVGGVFALIWKARDELAATAALCIVMLIVPTFTYEHHTVFLIPAVVAVAIALVERRLNPVWLVGLVPAYTLSAWQLTHLKKVALSQGGLVGWAMGEAKMVALLVLLAACLAAARSEGRAGR